MRVASAQSKRPAYHRLIHPHLQSMMYVCARILSHRSLSAVAR